MSETAARMIYIAGPMTGYTSYNALAFKHTAERWRAKGWSVVTPFEADSVVWRKHYGRDFDPHTDICDYGDPILAEMLAEDFATLCRADAVAVMDRWEQSKGASAEVLVAINLGKPLYDAHTFEPLILTASVSFARRDA